MAKKELHEEVSRLVLGDEYKEYHAFLDHPYRIFGQRHRQFLHDWETCLKVAKERGLWAGLACSLHIDLDMLDFEKLHHIEQRLSKPKVFHPWLLHDILGITIDPIDRQGGFGIEPDSCLKLTFRLLNEYPGWKPFGGFERV